MRRRGKEVERGRYGSETNQNTRENEGGVRGAGGGGCVLNKY